MFAALSFTMSRGFRSEGTSKLSKRQAELVASEILARGQAVKRTVERLQRKGCSENELSFYSDKIDIEAYFKNLYDHANAPADNSCHIFHPDGGNLNYINSYPNADSISQFTGGPTNLYKSYMFVRRGQGIGVGELQKAELSMVISHVTKDVCEAYNKLANKDPTMPAGVFWGSQNDLVNGIFNDNNDTAARLTGLDKSGAICMFHSPDRYTLIYIIIAR